MNPLTKEDIGQFQGVLFIRLGLIQETVAGLKEEIENYQEKTKFYNGHRSITQTRALMLIEKWFGNVLK